MIIKERVFKLVVVLLMLIAATITVNKSLFGNNLLPKVESEEPTEAVVDSGDGKVTISTEGMEGTIDGFAGPVPLNITIENGRISNIEVLTNSETPSFMRRAVVLLEQWTGKTPEDALAMKVDAVSGATYSSNAIISNVNAGMAYYDGIEASNRPEVPLKLWIALAVTLAACIVPLFVKSKVYYNVQLLANVIVLGFWAGQFLDYYMILEFLAHGVALPLGLVICVMLISAFIYPVFGKTQYYCNHVCPLGSAQILAGEICGFKIKITPKLMHALDWFRRLLWGALMLTLWFDCWTDWLDWELFQAFQFESATGWIIGVAIGFILLSLVVSRPYCRFVCPTGSIFKFIDTKG